MPNKSKYSKELCDLLVAHMKEGNSYESFAAVCDCGRTTLYDWESKFPEWKDAKELGQAHCLRWWENLGKALIVGKIKGGPAAIYIFHMKNRFNWKDVQRNEVTGADGQSFKIIVEDYTTPTKT